jgi:hypothetical protein
MDIENAGIRGGENGGLRQWDNWNFQPDNTQNPGSGMM